MYFGIISIIAINTANSFIRPVLQGKIIDDLSNVANAAFSPFLKVLALFLGLTIANYVLIYLQRFISTVIAEKIAADMRQRVHDKLATVKTTFFEYIELSDILLKVDKDVSVIKQCGITSVITLISNITIVIVIFPCMLSIHRMIAIIALVLLISVPFISRILGKKIQKVSQEVLNGYNDITSILTDTYNNWFVIRLFRCYQYVHDKYYHKNQEYKEKINKQNLLYTFNVLMVLVVQFLGTVIIWIVGAREVFKETMTVGTIMTLLSYQAIIMNPIIGIADYTNDFHTAIISLRDIKILLEYDDNESKRQKVEKISRIRLLNVDFAYKESENKVFENINISFTKGNLYAIHGKSGQGKSTLFRLLTGISAPTSGKILIEDYELTECDLNNYWKNVGYVMQRSQFFKDSILTNLKFYNDIKIENIEEVSKKLDLYDEVHTFTDTWKTEIKTEPYNLSEGQLRRLDIMRNIIKDPEVLLFDEVTANIDKKRRKNFYSLLHELSKDKIIIFSTHNQEELLEADVVIDLAEL
ncbi:ABC transporter transmembrane domain-containing protein [Lachnotalea glycerini]|uniref:ABC transporter transmembrane domain-containing protein n=1 Tax=Lachnotalea glycerini TaxID=1763509 RepID=UPI001FA8B65F|nr:ABC transporter ATP-binding protein [Lachnotalea glycerini]